MNNIKLDFSDCNYIKEVYEYIQNRPNPGVITVWSVIVDIFKNFTVMKSAYL